MPPRNGRKTAEKRQFHAAKPGDIDEGFGPAQHRKQRQQKHLVERIRDLAALAWIRQILEVIEEYHGLPKSAAVRRYVFHNRFPPTESRGSS